jgi:PKD repeat protein
MPAHSLLRVSLLLGAVLITSRGLVPPEPRAQAARGPENAAWRSADVTGDGVIDQNDVSFVIRHIGERCTQNRRVIPGDLNRDCRVDDLDLEYVRREARNEHERRNRHKPPHNAPPRPRPDFASTSEDVAVTIAVLANDVDPNGHALRVISASAGRLGTTAVRHCRGVTPVAAQDASGVDALTSTIADTDGLTAPQTGARAVRHCGVVTYTPAQNANGTDTFAYTVANTHGLTATAIVTVTIIPVNDPPAVTATASASSGTAPLEVTFSAVGTDVDGDPLTYTWSFGDGQSGQGSHLAHTYVGDGDFDVAVVVSDGAATATASMRVSVAPGQVVRPGAYVVDTAAGTGVPGYEGEGGPATSARLSDPRQVVIAPDGSFYIAELFRIVRVDAAGTLTRVRTLTGSSGDEGVSIAVGPDGAVYYTDADVEGYCSESGSYAEVRVRRLSPSDVTDPVVATWVNQDRLGSCSPSVKLAIDGEGSFYVGAARYVAKLLPGATGAATWVQEVTDFAYALAGDPGGGVLVGGFGSVVKIAADGTATPFAGTGTHGSTGDGGPALDAQVGTVAGLTVCPDGTVTFLEFDLTSFSPRIREVTRDNVIATIGGGTSGFNGDGRLALDTAFGFSLSAGIASRPEGGFYVADRDNVRVRRLVPVTTAAAPAVEPR